MLCTFFCKFKPTPHSVALFFCFTSFRKSLAMGSSPIWRPCPIILHHFARQWGALYRVKQHTLRHNSIAISGPKRLSTCASAITCRLVVRRMPIQQDCRSVTTPILMGEKEKCPAAENPIKAGKLRQRKNRCFATLSSFPDIKQKEKTAKMMLISKIYLTFAVTTSN